MVEQRTEAISFEQEKNLSKNITQLENYVEKSSSLTPHQKENDTRSNLPSKAASNDLRTLINKNSKISYER